MQIFPGRLSYLLVLAIALIDAVWIGVAKLAVPLSQLLEPVAIVAALSAVVLLINARTYSDARTQKIFFLFGYLFQGMIFLQVAWIAIRLFNHVSMTTDFPFADRLLIGWDNRLGLDWTAYFNFVEDNRLVRTVLGYSYTSLTLFSFAAFLLLIFQGEVKRTRLFLEAFLFAAIICTTAGMLFPAKAAVAMYYGDATTLAHLSSLPGVYHIVPLERLRSGVPFALDLNNLPGLVTFPSFHTAAAIILAVSFWRNRLFPIVLAYCLILIASTPVFGGHYFVDLIGGGAVALLVAAVFASLPYYKGLFARTDFAAGRAEARPSRVQAPG